MVAENAKYTSLHRPPLAGQLIRSAFSTLLLTAMVLFSTVFIHAGNVLGYLNVGTHFNAFPPSLGGVEFSDALAFLKEVPFNKIDMLDKWVSPIRVRYEGHYNIKDIEVLNNIAQCFSSVEGFPGIQIVNKDENVLVTYVTSNEFPLYKAKYEATADNTGFCMHYSTDGVIQKGNIIVINEGLQGFKNSVVLHEFFHLIGFYDHTSLRESILNKQGPVPYISPVDLLAFKMIYSPGISPKSSYDDIERHYQNADIRAYVPANDSTSLPDLRIPATILVLFILIRFLLSLKRTGLFSSVLKLGVSAIVCLTVFVVFTLYYDILLGLVS